VLKREREAFTYPAIQGVIMKTEIKSLIVKAKYQLWRLTKALEFVLRDDSKTHKEYMKEMYSRDLMKSTLTHLDRLPKHTPQLSDNHADWFVGVIPHDWEKHVNSKIEEKEKKMGDNT
jgi:hypothetical protein